MKPYSTKEVKKINVITVLLIFLSALAKILLGVLRNGV